MMMFFGANLYFVFIQYSGKTCTDNLPVFEAACKVIRTVRRVSQTGAVCLNKKLNIMRVFFLYLFSVVASGYIFTANAATSAIGFGSVAEALKMVEKQPGARINTTEPDKWTIVNLDIGDGGMEQWPFTPEGHYAHPAVAKRTIKVGADGQVYLESAYLCEAQKESCDRLVKEFETLNEQIRNNVQRHLSGVRK